MQYPVAILVSSCMWATSAWILHASHLPLHEAEMPLPISENLHLLFTYQGDVSRRRRGELSYHMFWFLWEAKVEHGSNIRMCGVCMQSQVKQKLSDWADAGPAGAEYSGGKWVAVSAQLLWWVEQRVQWTLRTRAVLQPATATTWTLCCSIEMSRDQRVSVAAGTELIIGQNCFITPDFCWKMAKICMVATSQMPGSIIKLSQYYHTIIPTPHSSQKCKNHPSLALLRPHIYMMTCSSEIYF